MLIHRGSILAAKIDEKSRSIFDAFLNNSRGGSGGTGGVPLKTEYGLTRDRKYVLHAATSTWTVLRRILGVSGYPWTSILGSWGGPWRPFWGSGGTPGRLWRAGGSKGRLPGLGSLHFKRFWNAKGSQKAPKMEPNSLTNRFKHVSKLWSDF